MPVRSSNDPVHYDSQNSMWLAVRDGVIDSSDVTQSLHLRNNMSINLPAPSPTNWAAEIQATSPFGMQTRPFVVKYPSTPAPTVRSSNTPPPAPMRPVRAARSARLALGELTNSKEIEIGILKLELAEEERAHEMSRGMLSRFIDVARNIENA